MPIKDKGANCWWGSSFYTGVAFSHAQYPNLIMRGGGGVRITTLLLYLLLLNTKGNMILLDPPIYTFYLDRHSV